MDKIITVNIDVYALGTREKVIEKLKEAVEYLESRTDTEFIGVHDKGSTVIQIKDFNKDRNIDPEEAMP